MCQDKLRLIAEKVGDSIAAITNEVETEKMSAAKMEASTLQPAVETESNISDQLR
jgi:hypothetical protein